MDESVKLFQEEQEQFAKAGGVTPWLRRQFLNALVGLFLFSLVSVVLMAGLGTLPRDSDHSIGVIYRGPILTAVGIGSAIALRRYHSMSPWLRPTLWALIALPLLMVPAMLFDMFWRNGS